MLRSEYYKIAPINDSFVQSIEALINKYETKNIRIYTSNISPDTCYFIINGVRVKPDFMFITINITTDESWTNAGGIDYCILQLLDKSKIDIRWETSKDKNHKYKEFSIKDIRKMKLKKINNAIMSD